MREQSSHNNFVRERMVFTTTLAYSLPSFLCVCIMLHCVDLYLYLFVCLSASIANSIYNDLISHLNDGKQKQQSSGPGLPNTYRTVFFLNWAGLAGLGKAGHIRDTQPGFSLGRCWRRCRSLLIMASLLFTAVVFANIGFSTTIILGTQLFLQIYVSHLT